MLTTARGPRGSANGERPETEMRERCMRWEERNEIWVQMSSEDYAPLMTEAIVMRSKKGEGVEMMGARITVTR